VREQTRPGARTLSGSDGQPYEMESHLTSSETTTESQSTDSADELTEPVTAEMASSVNGSPGVEMGMSGDAIPVTEVEPEDPTEVNTVDQRVVINDLSPANALMALNRSAPRQDLSYVQIPRGSPSEENVAVCHSMSVSAVPMSVDEMPVLVHAYAPIASPGQPSGVDPPRPTSSSVDFQSIVNLLGGIDRKMQTVFDDARQRSVEMHGMFSHMENNTYGMLNDVKHRMNERESHLMSEIESRTLRQQEAIQACQESLRTQVTVMQTQVNREREVMQAQMEKMMQIQSLVSGKR